MCDLNCKRLTIEHCWEMMPTTLEPGQEANEPSNKESDTFLEMLRNCAWKTSRKNRKGEERQYLESDWKGKLTGYPALETGKASCMFREQKGLFDSWIWLQQGGSVWRIELNDKLTWNLVLLQHCCEEWKLYLAKEVTKRLKALDSHIIKVDKSWRWLMIGWTVHMQLWHQTAWWARVMAWEEI